MKIQWYKKWDNRGIFIVVLALAAGAGVMAARFQEEKRRLSIRQEALTKDYPAIVSMLSLYVSAGVTVRSAFKRIFTAYKRDVKTNKDKREGYECMGIVLRKMEDGVGEMEAYSELARITENENYMRLSMLLTKNLKRGQKNLAGLLEKEETDAFAKRKLMAKRLGEEASTKLLVPMMLLLGVVLVIMIVPAMLSLKM